MQYSDKSVKVPRLNANGHVVRMYNCLCMWVWVHIRGLGDQKTTLGVIPQSLSSSLPLLTQCLSLAQDLTK